MTSAAAVLVGVSIVMWLGMMVYLFPREIRKILTSCRTRLQSGREKRR